MRAVFPPIISAESATLIFGKIEEILSINQELYSSLAADKTPRVGQTFLKFVRSAPPQTCTNGLQAPALKMYSEFCKDYPASITKLSKKMQEDRFSAFLKVYNYVAQHDLMTYCVQKCKDEHYNLLDLPSMMIMPVQRIPRYKLLLVVRNHKPILFVCSHAFRN